MSKFALHCISILILLNVSEHTHAQSLRMLSSSVNTRMTPEHAYFVTVTNNEKVSVVPAISAPSRIQSSTEGEQLYLAAAQIEAKTFPFVYSLVIESSQGMVRAQEQNLPLEMLSDENTVVLEGVLIDVSAEMLKLKKSLSAIDAELRRLRSDVEVIADIGRIVVLREERIRLEALLTSIDQEERTLKDSLSLLRSLGTPSGYLGRRLSWLKYFLLTHSSKQRRK